MDDSDRPMRWGGRMVGWSERLDRAVCVYCASSGQSAPAYTAAARRLGELLAVAGRTIVYGGSRAGSMGALADGALARGGQVVGVMPRFLQALELAHDGLSELHVVEDMRSRKHEMLARSSAVVALPGGSGTLEELLEAVTLKRLGIYLGPIIICNLRNYYAPLLVQFAAAVTERFMDERHLSMWQVVANVDEVLRALESAPPWPASALEFANL
jgi:uncharacterized protein (TIGR00730 family)